MLTQFLPKSVNPNLSRWKDVDGDRDRKVLVLGSAHSVHATLGGDKVSGTDEVIYNLEVPKQARKISDTLTINESLPLVGFQSSEELRELLERVKVRQSFSLAAVGDSAFDLRSLCYVLGSCAATASSGASFDMSQHVPAHVRLLSPTWHLPSVTSLTVGPGIADTGPEFSTLARLCGMAGVDNITLMADVCPPQVNSTLEGMSLGSFCMRVFAHVMNAAQSCACGSLHLQAFFCGLNQHFTLRSHTDEGGWIRGPLKNCMFPPSVGVLAYHPGSFANIPTSRSIVDNDLPKVVIALFLELVGTLVCSDPGEGKDVVTLVKEGTSCYPSNFPTLRPAFYRLMARFRALLCEDFDLHVSTVGDDTSSEPFWRADAEDTRHFGGELIVPFFWVEPGPLTVKARDYNMVGIQGKLTMLPFCSGEMTWKSRGYQEFDKRAVRGSASFVRFKGHNPRMDGMSYLLSQRYRRANGLAYAEMVVQPSAGVVTTDALFVEEGTTILSERAWVTPHNPVRSPMEGRTNNALMMKYVYRGGFAEPNHQDWSSAEVASFFGAFTVKRHGVVLPPKKIVRHASKAQLEWLSNRGLFVPGTMFDLSAFPDLEEPHIPGGLEDFPPPAAEPHDGGRDEEKDDEVSDDDLIEDLPPLTFDPPQPTEDDGLKTTVPIDPASGMRLVMPNVQLETEDVMGEGDVTPSS